MKRGYSTSFYLDIALVAIGMMLIQLGDPLLGSVMLLGGVAIYAKAHGQK